MTKFLREYWVFLLIFAATIFLFYPSLNYYFFQDDWFVLKWAKTGDLFSFFKFRTDIIYWRPLSMPIFFKLNNLLFDLNPTGFHLTSFTIHLINVLLFYRLLRTLKIKKKICLFSTFLYATASFHFISLSWISTSSYVIGPAFVFSSIIFYLKEKILLSLLFFLLALGSTEFALITPLMFLILRDKDRFSLSKITPFLLILAFYLLLRFIIFPLPARDNYQLIASLNIFKNSFWYIAWFFNIPEKMIEIFYFSSLGSSIVKSLEFIKYLFFPFTTFLIYIWILIRGKLKYVDAIKGFGIFLIGVLPVVFLERHLYPMYLSLASLGPFFLLSKGFEKIKKYQFTFIILFVMLWFLGSWLTITFERKNHWIVNLQAISRAYVTFTKKVINSPVQNSGFLFRLADQPFSQNFNFTLVDREENIMQALNNQDAIQIIYDDYSLKSLYYGPNLKLSEGLSVYDIYPDINRYQQLFK